MPHSATMLISELMAIDEMAAFSTMLARCRRHTHFLKRASACHGYAMPRQPTAALSISPPPARIGVISFEATGYDIAIKVPARQSICHSCMSWRRMRRHRRHRRSLLAWRHQIHCAIKNRLAVTLPALAQKVSNVNAERLSPQSRAKWLIMAKHIIAIEYAANTMDCADWYLAYRWLTR